MSDTPYRVGAEAEPGVEDPDMRDPLPGEAPTQYDDVLGQLEKALSQRVETEYVTYPVHKRPGVSIRFRTELDDDKLGVWRKNATDRRNKQVDSMRFLSIVLANLCDAFLFNGKEPREDDGSSLTFASPRIKRLVDVPENGRAADCVRPILAADPHVLLMGNELLDACGFGDDMVAVEDDGGPTSGS